MSEPVEISAEIAVIRTCTEQLMTLQGDKAALDRALRYINDRFRKPGGAMRDRMMVPDNA